MVNKIILIFLIIIVCITLDACKDAAPTNGEEPGPAESSVSGKLTFLDGTPGVGSRIQLALGYTYFYDTTDSEGNFSFNKLQRGNYALSFNSTDYTINTSKVQLSLNDKENKTQNLYILYKLIDEFRAIEKNSDVVFMQLQPDGAKIGTNYSAIKYLSGFFRRDYLNRASLTFEIYQIPEDSLWSIRVPVTADFVKSNFQYVTEVTEEPVFNYNHEVRFSGEKIPLILSNPPNGFAFVKKDSLNKELKIPCVDFSNNDFGFVINY